MELVDLFITATMPVFKVLFITALGSCLALQRINVLGEDTRKELNRVVFYVFNPALVATNLANTITSDSMLKLWFMPFNVLITFIVGSILGWIVVQWTRPPSHLRGLIVGCCAAGNMGNMLLIIIPALCKEKGSPFGDPDVCYTYGMGYVSLSMAIGAIYLWSYVYNIVRISSSASSKEPTTNNSITNCSTETSTSEQGSIAEPLLPSKEFLAPEDCRDKFVLPCTRFQGKVEVIHDVTFSLTSFLYLLHGYLQTTLASVMLAATSHHLCCVGFCLLLLVVFSGTLKHLTEALRFDFGKVSLQETVLSNMKQQVCLLVQKINLRALFAPSTIAVIVGFVIGLIPQIRKLMIGGSAPLRVIQDSASLLGDGAIPALTLIVGGNLLKGLRGSGIQTSIILGIIVARYIALPLIGVVIVKAALYFGFVHSDALYQFVLLLQFAVPPAMNIGTITQLFGAGESECSVIMLWTYALASVSLTMWSTFFMWLVA